MNEMIRQEYKPNEKWFDPFYRGTSCKPYEKLEEVPSTCPIYPEHNQQYLIDLFVEAQGIDPTDFAINNATGTAIKMLYSHLELKASMTESYFRDSLNELVRAIMQWLNISDYESRKINQKWTRTAIHNSLEDAQVISQVSNVSFDEAIAKANPIVDDWQEEMKNRRDDEVNRDGYSNPDNLNNLNGNEDD